MPCKCLDYSGNTLRHSGPGPYRRGTMLTHNPPHAPGTMYQPWGLAPMTGKPKNHRALKLAAYHCTHPALDAKDKLLLSYLAELSDYSVGTNARAALADFMGLLGEEGAHLTRRPIKERIAKNIERGLLKCTEVGNGAGKASTYRLCLENEHYPDHTPSGKCLLENCAVHGSTDDEENRAVHGSTVGNKYSAVQGSTVAPKTVLPNTENCAVKTKNRAVQEEKPCCAEQHDTTRPPDPHHQPTTNLPTAGGLAGGGEEPAPSAALDPLQTQEDDSYEKHVQEWEWKEWQVFKRGVPEALQATGLGGEQKEAVQKQVKRYGTPVVLGAVTEWAAKRDLTGLKNKWWAWLEECEPFLARARAADKERKFAEKLTELQRTQVPEMEANGYLATASEQDRHNWAVIERSGAGLLTHKDRAKLEAWLTQAEGRYFDWQDEQEDAEKEEPKQ